MVRKGIRAAMCHATCRYAETNIKYMKDYDPDKELPYVMYLHESNFYGWWISQKLPVDGFHWVEDTYCWF